MAGRVEVNTAAPDFSLKSLAGDAVRLSDYQDQKHVFLVFNRGFS